MSSTHVTDDEVISRIADRIADRNIPSFARIGLDVQRGVITVRGNVTSKGERLLLNHILRTTPGVLKVIDGLTMVRPKRAASRFNLSVAPLFAAVFEMPYRLKIVSAVSFVVGTGVLMACWSPHQSVGKVAVYPVKGRVVMDGAAIPNASIILHPVGTSPLPIRVQPRATAESDGGFVVATFTTADGAPEGDFVATVHLMKPVIVDGDSVPGPNVLPSIYSRPETSPFRVRITRDTKELAALELHKKMKRAPDLERKSH